MRIKTSLFYPMLLILFATAGVASAQPGRTRPAAQGDIKVTYRTTLVAGQSSESVTMIKGTRERSEMRMGYGFDQITVTQCDLKRTIQISDSAKKYVITPMDTGDTPTTPPAKNVPASSPVRKGGVVNYVATAIDTGERKEMFGFTARHVKQTISIQSSPDACNAANQKMELDGWYIDLTVGLECHLDRPPVAPMGRAPKSGCQDQVRFRREGTAKTGFPLIETMTMYGPNGQVQVTTTKEVVELSRQPLDAALFDIPAGYTEAASTEEFYSAPNIAQMMAQANSGRTQPNNPSPSISTPATKEPGAVLIGVVQINNKAGKQVDLESLRSRLVGQLEGSGVSAVALNASSQTEAEVEAKTKQCDFILYTDLTTLKMNKLGGMFGAVTGGTMPKTEAKVEFKLFAVGESAPRLQSSANAKVEGEEASAGSAIDNEARTVATEAKKKKN